MIRYRLRYEAHKLIKPYVSRFQNIRWVTILIDAFSLGDQSMEIIILDSGLDRSVPAIQLQIIQLGNRIIYLSSASDCRRYIKLRTADCHMGCRSAVFGNKPLNTFRKYPFIARICLRNHYNLSVNIHVSLFFEQHYFSGYPLAGDEIRSRFIDRNDINTHCRKNHFRKQYTPILPEIHMIFRNHRSPVFLQLLCFHIAVILFDIFDCKPRKLIYAKSHQLSQLLDPFQHKT